MLQLIASAISLRLKQQTKPVEVFVRFTMYGKRTYTQPKQ